MSDAIIPKAFFEKYKKILPKEEFEKFEKSCYKGLRKSIRVNTLKISVADFKEKAVQEGWELSSIPWCEEGFWIERKDRTKSLGKSYLHTFGYFYVQEASSMIPPTILDVQKGEKILDMSAAPGSKTTQLSAMMQNSGIIVANEPEVSRIKAMSSNMERLGVINTIITQKDGRVFSQYFPNYFDKILLDAPCTGEGTVRKDRSALEFWNEKAIESISNLQKTLLFEAFHSLKKGGELVYSTCTLSPEENEYAVQFLLDNYPEAELVKIETNWNKNLGKNEYGLDGVVRVWPHIFDTEGFFIAKIRKNEETFSQHYEGIKPWKRKSPFQKISKDNLNKMSKYFKEIGIKFKDLNKELNLENKLFQRNSEIWLRPEKCEDILSKISSHGSGVEIGKTGKFGFNLGYFGVRFFEKFMESETLDLDKKILDKVLKGEDIPNETGIKKGIILITYKKLNIGYMKIVGNKLKNKLPRYFVFN